MEIEYSAQNTNYVSMNRVKMFECLKLFVNQTFIKK